MIKGIGVDLVSVERIGRARARHGGRFLEKVFTPAEAKLCLSRKFPDAGLAARFAAKEAAMKALSTGWAKGVGWKDVEVDLGDGGAPRLNLKGQAAAAAGEMGVSRAFVSLAHDGGYAVATVVLEGEEGSG